MRIVGNNNLSQLKTCLAAAKYFLISEVEARAMFDQQIQVIQQHWHMVCDEAELSKVDRLLLWNRQFLNPYSIIID